MPSCYRNDAWGYYIYSVIKQGSINLACESRRMAIPHARFLGLRSLDYCRCQLSPSVQIKLNEQDIKRVRQIAQYPWFVEEKALAKGNRADVEERFQARSRSPNRQRHQLCYGRIRTCPVEGERLSRLAGGYFAATSTSVR